jgi:hypothetical protein
MLYFLQPFMLSCISGLMQVHGQSDSEWASNIVQFPEECKETLAVIRQAFREENISHAWVF